MPFPDFEPCTPVFLRSLRSATRRSDLIVYEGRRLTYGEAAVAVGSPGPRHARQRHQQGQPDRAADAQQPGLRGGLAGGGADWRHHRSHQHVLQTQGTRLRPASRRHPGAADRRQTAEQRLPGAPGDLYPAIAASSRAGAGTSTPLLLREFPFLRQIYVWGDSSRPWSRSQQHLLGCGGCAR